MPAARSARSSTAGSASIGIFKVVVGLWQTGFLIASLEHLQGGDLALGLRLAQYLVCGGDWRAGVGIKAASSGISECGDEEMALPDETLTIRGSYVRMFAKAKIKPRGVMVTNSFELMRASAATGLCVAIVNKYFGGSTPPRGLKYVPLRGKGVEKWPLNICVHTDRNLPVAVRIFLEHLQEAVRRATADD